jgi:predicted porin
MQKKLLSLAIAGALAVPGAAMADVTASGADVKIYGKFHASYDFVDTDAGSSADDSDDNTGVFRNSRLGFKGSEDLGNGLKAIWQVETHLDTAENGTANSGRVGLRNTFVGLAGDSWGKVFLGRHDTPYKTATAKLDIFSDTIADYNNIIGRHMVNPEEDITKATYISTSSFNEREPQIIAYATPNMNGFSAQVARGSYQNDENAGDKGEELEAWSVMGMYDQGPFFASLAYEKFSGGAEASSKIVDKSKDNEMDAWKVGLGYKFGNSKISGVYESIEHDSNTVAGKTMSRDAFWGAFSHKFGANEVKLAYGKADDSDVNGTDDGADNWSIGIDHNFSKRTKVYAIYTKMDNDANGQYSLYTADNNGGTSGFYKTENGKDPSAFSLGVIHKF